MSKLNYWKIMTRRKPMPQPESNEDSKLGKVFGTFDLTALGVSATLGVGVYVLAGHVAKDQAGPSVILSFLIAAAASFLAGLCYAEFASRVPKSGSAYIFTYVAIGEFLAFIVGWNLILEYIIGAASISKGLSLYIDSLANDAMKKGFMMIAPMSWDFLSPYFDFFAFGCPLVIGLALAFGLRKSAGINNIFCILNLGVVAYVVVAVLCNADLRNWNLEIGVDIPPEYNSTAGTGGFFPFGFSGTLKGAATCFFGFVGFDCIATTGEEVRNPQKTVPRALLLSLLIIFIAYFGVSTLTLMSPYYLLNREAPLPHAFEEIGWISSMWLVTVGGIFGLLASLFGAMFPLPRILYAMAQDGLIFREFAVISHRFQTPVIGTLCSALLTGCFAALFDLTALVSMLSIGVLLAYTVVAISIIILRFSQSLESTTNERYIETSNLLRPGYNLTAKGFVLQLIRQNASRQPNTISMWVVGSLIVCYCLVSLGLSLTILYSWNAIADGETWALVLVLFLAAVLLLFCILISIQPRQKFQNLIKPFKVPIVPFLPAISIFINIYLMLMLDCYTWIRFGVWMILGIIVYFPCAWLYNSPIQKPNDETTKETTSCDDEIIIVEKANGSVSSEGGYRSNEGAAIKSTCETENVIIVHENHRGTSATESFINNKLSVEANLAIEMLDTVLDAEDESDSVETESNSRRESTQSINGKDVNVPETMLCRENSDEKSPPNTPTETINLQIIDSVSIRREIEAEIDEILKIAQESVKVRLNGSQSEDDDGENIFENRKFLTRLSNLISSKSNQQTSPRLNVQSKTLERKSETAKVALKHSKSVPDFKLVLQSLEKSSKDDAGVAYILIDVKGEEPETSIPPPPIFSAELFERIATLKRRKISENKQEEIENSTEDRNEDTKSLEDESDNKENFRDKLEKLLGAPPTRLSLIAPIPLPRTSLIKLKDDNQVQKASPKEPSPIKDATMQKQRELFNEVLRNLKGNDNGEKVPTVG